MYHHNPWYLTKKNKIRFIYHVFAEDVAKPKSKKKHHLSLVTKYNPGHDPINAPLKEMKIRKISTDTKRFKTKEAAQHEIMRRERFPKD